MQMRWLGVLLLVGLLAGAGLAGAQEIQTCVPIKTQINTVNAGVDIPVDATAVDVLTLSTTACQRLIWNTGTAPMRCMSKIQGRPSSTEGLLIQSGQQILLGTEGREAWWCIRTGLTGTVATTIEGIP